MLRRTFHIVAQDPSIAPGGDVLTARISLPADDLDKGPMGSAVYIVDYDASAATMYREAEVPDGECVVPATREELLSSPAFHALNAYAIVTRTLMRFEYALGRRVGWGIPGHQLKVVPHAFEKANAFYNPELESLLFGYIRGDENTFFCLSHDVVVHETAHALLDGLRDKFLAPASPDQAAFHEAFADIVALLSVFSLPEVPRHLLAGLDSGNAQPDNFVSRSDLSVERLRETALFGLADQIRNGSHGSRFNALRRSVSIEANPKLLEREEFQESHRRGEVLVAGVMQAFLEAWDQRIDAFAAEPGSLVSLDAVAQAGSDIADAMLTMAIRAIDYTPPIHITFADYLSAMLTADTEVRADDTRFDIRGHLRRSMSAFGIEPPPGTHEGCWPRRSTGSDLQRSGIHLSALQTDPVELFRLIWNNRSYLDKALNPHAHTRIESVRPCLRVSPEDGFHLRETVVECVQYLKLTAAELDAHKLKPPDGMPPDTAVDLQGGATLILDEYGDLKYAIGNPLPTPESDISEELAAQWQERLEWLWHTGYLRGDADASARLAAIHSQRTMNGDVTDSAAERRRVLRNLGEAWND